MTHFTKQYNPGYGNEVDQFAFGLVLNEMCTGRQPFIEFEEHMIGARLKKGERPPMDTTQPPRLLQLINSCWAQNPQDRPSFSKILDTLNELAIQLQPATNAQPLFPDTPAQAKCGRW